ncbi:MAG: hypothetical protein D6788_07340 [Planctomycetota bacterium]|nr:MAG: hypothetical protein D6788_07340 [Planctomycetota bacterium]
MVIIAAVWSFMMLFAFSPPAHPAPEDESTWSGEMRIGQTVIPLKLRLHGGSVPAGEAWVAQSTTAISLAEIRREGSELAFSIPARPAPFRIRGRITGSRFTGKVAVLPGVAGTVELHRSDPGSGNGRP